jgi:hypothetical protein
MAGLVTIRRALQGYDAMDRDRDESYTGQVTDYPHA